MGEGVVGEGVTEYIVCHPITVSPCHPITVSPCHPITVSPCHRVTLSPNSFLPLQVLVLEDAAPCQLVHDNAREMRVGSVVELVVVDRYHPGGIDGQLLELREDVPGL